MAKVDAASHLYGKQIHLHRTLAEDSPYSADEYSFIGEDWNHIPPGLCQSLSSNTRRLDISFNRLTSLAGVNELLSLEELVVDNNQLGDDVDIPTLHNLHTLTLNNNNFKDLDGLLAKLKQSTPHLSYLSLLGNIACPSQLSDIQHSEGDYRRYRLYVVHHLPHLKFLDSSAVKNQERMEAQRQGQFLKVVRPTVHADTNVEEGNECSPSQYTPLPDTSSDKTQPTVLLGQTRYIYYGKHSEGNRFIKNSDL